MMWIAGGRFTMGSGAQTDDNDAAPAHPVTLDPYCIDVREVTAKDYQTCVDARRCKPARSVAMPNLGVSERKLYSSLCTHGRKDKQEYPINCVTWRQAERYCSSMDKRLPTEAEWELAALGAVPHAYPWGDEEPTPAHVNACNGECVAWAKEKGLTWPGLAAGDDGYPTLAPVGQFPRGNTASGLQDLAGNVAEWVEDGYAPYPESAVENPRGMPRADRRVVRGGAWNSSYARAFRPFVRRAEPFTRATAEIGFRCASKPLP
jgi:formylglycine-generating enzyme required for sulfatase activity